MILLFGHKLTIARVFRTKRIFAADCRDHLQKIPFAEGFFWLLHFHQIHRMDFPSIAPDVTLAEQRVVGGQLFHSGDYRLAVGSRSDLIDCLEKMEDESVNDTSAPDDCACSKKDA
jgi:hypothetical protein